MRYTLEEHKNKELVPKNITESVSIKADIDKEAVRQLTESAKSKKRKLIVKMEAIHVGRTANYNYYTKEGLKAGVKSWTAPYNKPVLTHHNDYNGEPIGRILKAEFAEETLSGKPGLVFTVEISDPDAIEKVLDGRYQTVSIGAETDRVTCNICGTDRTKEWCEHWPGQEYDGQVAHFIIGTVYGKEVSYVNVPADENARNISVTITEDDTNASDDKEKKKEAQYVHVFQVAEGLLQDVRHPTVNLYEHVNDELKKMLDGLVISKERSEEVVPPESVAEDVKEVKNEDAQQEEVQEAEKIQETNEAVVENQENQEVIQEDIQADIQEDIQENKLNKKIAEMQKLITNLVLEKQKLESVITNLKEENQSLIKENVELHEKLHRQLAKEVVDIKRLLNKPDVVGKDYEECIKEHAERSEESLSNTLKDLQAELKAQRPDPGSVKNPGYSMAETQQEEEKKFSLKEAEKILKSMFSSKK